MSKKKAIHWKVEKFELNLRGLNKIMKSEEMQDHLWAAGEAVSQATMAGEYGVSVHTAKYVAIANVYPVDRMAAVTNSHNNALLKAVGSVGLSMSKGKEE